MWPDIACLGRVVHTTTPLVLTYDLPWPFSVLPVATRYGFRPLHLAAQFGDATFMESILALKPDLRATTTLGHTALHVAIMSGSLATVPALVLSGVPKDMEDSQGRTAMDIACSHSWLVANVSHLLGVSSAEVCQKTWKATPPVPPATWPTAADVGGGWFAPATGAPHAEPQQSCDIDVRDGIEADNFLFSYLAIQRPVRGRHACLLAPSSSPLPSSLSFFPLNATIALAQLVSFQSGVLPSNDLVCVRDSMYTAGACPRGATG